MSFFKFLVGFFKKENKIKKKRTKETTYLKLIKKFYDIKIPLIIPFENPQEAIFSLHMARKEFYTKEHILDLRICRYFEGKIQRLYGTIEQSTNAFMTVLYIDLIDSKSVFPNAYKDAFKEKLTEEKFKEIFLFNAHSLLKTLQFKPTITPEEAWEEILKYRKKIK